LRFVFDARMTRISKTWLGAAIAAVSLATGCIGRTFPKTPEAGGPAWRELTTEHFVIDSDLEPTEADTMARQLENLRNVMTKTVFGGEPAKGPRMRVLALRHDEYAQYDRVSSGNYLSWALFQPTLVITPGGDWATFESDLRKHELGHYVASLYVDMRLQPRWFAEGVAGYLQTLRYDGPTGAVEIGHRPRDYEYLTYAKQATFDELWGWDQEQPYDALTARLYQTSWAAVHYLYDQRDADLHRYERALAEGQDARRAWREIFPDLDGADFDEVLRKYIHKRDYKITKASVPELPALEVQTRTLAEADVLALRATLYMALQQHGKRTGDETKALAMQNLKASIEHDEASFWAHQANLFYFDSVTASVDVAERAIAGQKDNWLAWVWYAEVLRRSKGTIDQRRSALAKALELAPTNAVALTQLAWVEAESGHWKAALDASSKAVHSPPVGNDAMVVFSAALSRSGRCDEARTVEDQVGKRLKGKVPKGFSEVFEENRQACSSSARR
jgi:tetratricopeptide (TPR) repeat protein